jgi:hypothetical protein
MMALLGAVGDDVRGILDEDESLGLPPTIKLAELYVEVVSKLLHLDGELLCALAAILYAHR